MTAERQPEHRRNPRLEALLDEISGLLGPVESEVAARYHMPAYPVVLVMGLPRCGSTLTMQWLAASGRFGYPSNLLSRFYAAPYVGARIQQLLTDPQFSFGDELHDLASAVGFDSTLGKTRGALAPNEFWYFWRRFIPNVEPRKLTGEELSAVRSAEFTAELAALEAAFDKPLAMKGLILALDIPFLDRLLDNVLFLHVHRHPFYNVQSLLESRERYYGDRAGWYSIKPPEFDWLQDEDPITQVVGQVAFTSRAMQADLAQVDPARRLDVSYEAFCADPGAVWDQITQRLRAQGMSADWPYTGPQRFPDTNQCRLSAGDTQAVLDTYRRLTGDRLTL